VRLLGTIGRAPRIAGALLRLRRGRPTLASVNLLNRCNQACPMCAVHAGPDEELPLPRLRALLPALRRGGIRIVELSGGEPFLRRDLPELVATVDSSGLLFTFNTNATAVSEAGLEALGRARGLLQVAVSLDSLDRERYRRLRGRDLLPQALDGLERLRHAGLPAPVKLNVAVSRHNVTELPALLAFAAGRGLHLSAFPVTQGPGHHRSAGGPFQASPGEREAMAHAFETLAARRRAGEPLWEASAFYLAAARFLRGQGLEPCGAGALYLDVRADGSVAPCVDLPAVTDVEGLVRGDGWAALRGAGPSADACRQETPCCYTCTVNVAELSRHPLAYAAESARVLLRPRRPRAGR
jgi:MoaA/NifB/PqqE/SkfB family radical SAM enzyme